MTQMKINREKVFHLELFCKFSYMKCKSDKLLGEELCQLHKKIICNSSKVFAKTMRLLTPAAY